MLYRKLIIITILSVLIISCKKPTKYYILVNDATGLTKWTEVNANGVKIGELKKLGLRSDGKVWCLLYIDNQIKIPKGTKFYIEPSGLLGNKNIRVELINNDVYYLPNDTIATAEIIQRGLLESLTMDSTKRAQLDSLGGVMLESFVKIVETLAADSIKIDSAHSH